MHPAPRARLGTAGVLRQSDGLTLIEVLVCFMLLSLLAAAVFPVVTRRVARGEPAQVHEDLSAIAVALERFSADLDGLLPHEFGALFAPIDTAQRALLPSGGRARYPDAAFAAWAGPYLRPEGWEGDDGTSGYGVSIGRSLIAFDAAANRPAGVAGFDSLSSDLRAAVQIGTPGRLLTVAQFEAINDLVDGAGEPDGPATGGSWTAGRLRFGRFGSADTVAYFLAAPLEP